MHTQSLVKTTRLKLALLSAAAVLTAGASVSAYSASATATATALVVRPITVTKSADMSFGKFAPDTVAASTVTVATDGSLSKTGAAFLIPGATGTAAKFNVSGETSLTYAISYAALTQLDKGTDNMPISLFSTTSAASTASGTLATTGTLSAADPGVQSQFVGATLTVAANQPNGTYTGNIVITVDYN